MPCATSEKPLIHKAEKDILSVISENPGIKNNGIARKLGYEFDLRHFCRGRYVRKIVDSLVSRKIVARPNSGSTECWIAKDYEARVQ